MGLMLASERDTARQPELREASRPFQNRFLTIASSCGTAMTTSWTEQATLLSGAVLLVDDNEYSAQHTCRRLTELGLDVVVAVNGEEAVQLYTTSNFVAVLMDCEMPVMDGFTATMRIRNHEYLRRLPAAPVIAMTSCGVAVDRARWSNAGMNELLAKPIAPRVLADVLRRFLDDSSDAWPLEPRMRVRRLG